MIHWSKELNAALLQSVRDHVYDFDAVSQDLQMVLRQDKHLEVSHNITSEMCRVQWHELQEAQEPVAPMYPPPAPVFHSKIKIELNRITDKDVNELLQSFPEDKESERTNNDPHSERSELQQVLAMLDNPPAQGLLENSEANAKSIHLISQNMLREGYPATAVLEEEHIEEDRCRVIKEVDSQPMQKKVTSAFYYHTNKDEITNAPEKMTMEKSKMYAAKTQTFQHRMSISSEKNPPEDNEEDNSSSSEEDDSWRMNRKRLKERCHGLRQIEPINQSTTARPAVPHSTVDESEVHQRLLMKHWQRENQAVEKTEAQIDREIEAQEIKRRNEQVEILLRLPHAAIQLCERATEVGQEYDHKKAYETTAERLNEESAEIVKAEKSAKMDQTPAFVELDEDETLAERLNEESVEIVKAEKSAEMDQPQAQDKAETTPQRLKEESAEMVNYKQAQEHTKKDGFNPKDESDPAVESKPQDPNVARSRDIEARVRSNCRGSQDNVLFDGDISFQPVLPTLPLSLWSASLDPKSFTTNIRVLRFPLQEATNFLLLSILDHHLTSAEVCWSSLPELRLMSVMLSVQNPLSSSPERLVSVMLSSSVSEEGLARWLSSASLNDVVSVLPQDNDDDHHPFSVFTHLPAFEPYFIKTPEMKPTKMSHVISGDQIRLPFLEKSSCLSCVEISVISCPFLQNEAEVGKTPISTFRFLIENSNGMDLVGLRTVYDNPEGPTLVLAVRGMGAIDHVKAIQRRFLNFDYVSPSPEQAKKDLKWYFGGRVLSETQVKALAVAGKMVRPRPVYLLCPFDPEALGVQCTMSSWSGFGEMLNAWFESGFRMSALKLVVPRGKSKTAARSITVVCVLLKENASVHFKRFMSTQTPDSSLELRILSSKELHSEHFLDELLTLPSSIERSCRFQTELSSLSSIVPVNLMSDSRVFRPRRETKLVIISARGFNSSSSLVGEILTLVLAKRPTILGLKTLMDPSIEILADLRRYTQVSSSHAKEWKLPASGPVCLLLLRQEPQTHVMDPQDLEEDLDIQHALSVIVDPAAIFRIVAKTFRDLDLDLNVVEPDAAWYPGIDGGCTVEWLFPSSERMLAPLAVCIILKPSNSQSRRLASMLKRLCREGFDLLSCEMTKLTLDMVTFLNPSTEDERTFLDSGPVVILWCARVQGIAVLQELLGPEDPVVARASAPFSIRASVSSPKSYDNGYYGSSSYTRAFEEAQIFARGHMYERLCTSEAPELWSSPSPVERNLRKWHRPSLSLNETTCVQIERTNPQDWIPLVDRIVSMGFKIVNMISTTSTKTSGQQPLKMLILALECDNAISRMQTFIQSTQLQTPSIVLSASSSTSHAVDDLLTIFSELHDSVDKIQSPKM